MLTESISLGAPNAQHVDIGVAAAYSVSADTTLGLSASSAANPRASKANNALGRYQPFISVWIIGHPASAIDIIPLCVLGVICCTLNSSLVNLWSWPLNWLYLSVIAEQIQPVAHQDGVLSGQPPRVHCPQSPLSVNQRTSLGH